MSAIASIARAVGLADDPEGAARPARPARPLPSLPLAATAVHGNWVVTRTEVKAWFLLTSVPWSFRGPQSRMQTITDVAVTCLELTGQPAHLRGTNRPYPVPQYAEAYWRNSPAAPDKAALRRHVLALQEHLRHESLDDAEWYLGVTVLRRGGLGSVTAGAVGAALTPREHRRAAATAQRVTDALAASGSLHAAPLSQPEMDRLMHRSVGLGLPEPRAIVGTDAPADHADIATYTDGVDVDPRVGRRTLRVLGNASAYGVNVERYVSVLSLGRSPDYLDIPEEHDPWLAWAQRLPFPVEWSARFEVVAGETAAKRVNWKIKQMYDAQRQHADADIPEDEALGPALRDARRMESEMRNASILQSTRVKGWFDVAVSGRTPEEVDKRAAAVVRHYKRLGGQMVERGPAQEARYRAFIPGEPQATTHHRRDMPLLTFAAAVPHVSATVGDQRRRGEYLGHTQGHSRRCVVWDMHAAMEEHDRSGLSAIVGGLGSGKSVLMGLLCFYAALRGIHTTILDPSGPLARLTEHPDLAPYAEHIDLARGAPGILSPYSVIPDPVRERLADDPEVRRAEPAEREAVLDAVYANEQVAAEKARQQLALDILLGLLPHEQRGAADEHVREAVYAVPGRRTSTLGSVLDVLRHNEAHAARVACRTLAEMAKWPQVRLFFGNGESQQQDARGASTAVLTVITLGGVRLPKHGDESQWDERERLGVVTLAAAAHYATQRIYGKPMRERAVFGLDEAKRLQYVSSGRALLDHLARDLRKWNTRGLIASQKAQDFVGLDVDGLLGESFIGHISADAPREEHEAALRLVGIPYGYGYEGVLAGLSGGNSRRQRSGRAGKVREFLFCDVHGNREVIRIDGFRPDVMALLDTTPTQDRPAEEEPTWGDADVFDPALVAVGA